MRTMRRTRGEEGPKCMLVDVKESLCVTMSRVRFDLCYVSALKWGAVSTVSSLNFFALRIQYARSSLRYGQFGPMAQPSRVARGCHHNLSKRWSLLQ